MIGTIAMFESKTLLRSTQTWIIAGALALVFAYLFLQAIEKYLQEQPALALQDHPIGLAGYLAVRYLAPLVMVFALIAPLLAMKSFSEEYRAQTIALWQSSPVSSSALVIGKFAGIAIVISLFVGLACLIPALMRFFTPVDFGVLAASSLGLLLGSLSFAAIGLFFSSVTRHAIIAAAASVVLLLLFWLLGSLNASSSVVGALSLFAIPTHLNGFFQGFIGSGDIIYFVVLIGLFIGLTIVRMDYVRHAGS